MFIRLLTLIFFLCALSNYTLEIYGYKSEKKCSLIKVKEYSGELSPYFLKNIRDLFNAKTFVETGTFLGNTTAYAAEIFQSVYTIELSPEMYAKAELYLKEYPNIQRYLGDSGTVFKSILPKLDGPIVFWLDGHYSGNLSGHNTALGEDTSAILKELTAIKDAGLNQSIIMVDDIRLFDKAIINVADKVYGGYPTLQELLKALYAINKQYKIIFLGDILLAYPAIYHLNFSPFIRAITKSLLFDQGEDISLAEVLEAEKTIMQIYGAEKRYLHTLFETFCKCEATDLYGVGKQYIVWRGLAALGAKEYLDAYNWFAFAYKQKNLKHWRIMWYMAQAVLGAGYKEFAYKLLTEVIQKAPDFMPAKNVLEKLEKENISLAEILKPYDVTLVGTVQFAESLGRLAITVLEMLDESLKINCVISRKNAAVNIKDIPKRIAYKILNPDKTPGSVSLFFDLPVLSWDKPIQFVPDSTIKIAYSMVESSAVPTSWVSALNEKFDAIVVPDESLVEVYQKSGISLPLFVLPCPLYLEDFLAMPIKKEKNKPFVFGISAGFWDRKNHIRLIEAFAEEFGNNANIKLKLHSRMGEPAIRDAVQEAIKKYGLKNVEIIDKRLNNEDYINFMASLDCYVLLSKGEGFSITPREALAAGIPCIISNNTAHKKICDANIVTFVDTPIIKQANYNHISVSTYAGVDFDCTTQAARKALRDVYENYSIHIAKAYKGREWVKQYLIQNLKEQYMTLIKPQMVKFGKHNSLKNGVLITNNVQLYEKYKNIKLN